MGNAEFFVLNRALAFAGSFSLCFQGFFEESEKIVKKCKFPVEPF